MRHKDALGSLVTLENGKIKAEGIGEVQEMIDIADFAVGQARMLYGLTMHSERPQHRMIRAMAPARCRRNHLRIQFPGGRVGVEFHSSRRSAAMRFGVETLAQDSTHGDCGSDTSAIKVMRDNMAAPPIFQICSSMAAPNLPTRFVDDRRVALVSFTGSTAGRTQAWRERRCVDGSASPCSNSAATTRSSSMRSADLATRGAVDRVRCGRHGRSALHNHAACARASRITN